jgi:diguanylate cyclase (GGDEF)-like protein/PAS domain S-box-containing protein
VSDFGETIDRFQARSDKPILPENHWREFLVQVRRYSETIEHDVKALRENREQLLAIINLMPVAFFVKDHMSRFFLMNRACEEQWGMSFADLRDTTASQFFPPEQMEQFLATDRSIFENRVPVEFEETFWSAAKKSNRMGYTFKRPMYDADGNPQFLVCVTLDVTERRLAEVALRDSETRFREAITHSPNPIMMHAEDGEVIMISQALTEITGYRLEDLPNIGAWAEKVYAIPAARFQDQLKALYELTAVRYEGEFPIRTSSGEPRLWDIQTQPLPKLPDGRRVVLTLGIDITDRKRLERELQALATTDYLTGLPNRRQFLDQLATEFARTKRFPGQQTSVLMLDIDLFKQVNDAHGHPGGDAALRHLARLMRETLRAVDTAGRLGGEEFAIILPGAGLTDAVTLAERLRVAVAKTNLMHDGKTISLTISVGIAMFDRRDANADAALLRADKALYRAKKNGRDRVEVTVADLSASAA